MADLLTEQHFPVGPTTSGSVRKCAVWEIQTPRPLTEGQREAVVRDQMGFSHVLSLLLTGSPAAILWTVWSGVVNTFDRVLRGWGVSHVFSKAFEGHPPLTDVNPPTSVIGIGSGVRVAASFLHPVPALIHLRPRAPVLCRARLGQFSIQTAARLDRPIPKCASRHSFFRPTFAATEPPGLPRLALARCSTDYGVATEDFSIHLFSTRHVSDLSRRQGSRKELN